MVCVYTVYSSCVVYMTAYMSRAYHGTILVLAISHGVSCAWVSGNRKGSMIC